MSGVAPITLGKSAKVPVAVAVFIYGSAMSIEKGAITLGTVVAFVEYIKRFFIPIRDIGMKYSIIQSAFASADRIDQLLSEESFIDEPADQIKARLRIDWNPGRNSASRHKRAGFPPSGSHRTV